MATSLARHRKVSAGPPSVNVLSRTNPRRRDAATVCSRLLSRVPVVRGGGPPPPRYGRSAATDVATFVEEVLKALIVGGDLARADGAWRARPLEHARVPRTATEAAG